MEGHPNNTLDTFITAINELGDVKKDVKLVFSTKPLDHRGWARVLANMVQKSIFIHSDIDREV